MIYETAQNPIIQNMTRLQTLSFFIQCTYQHCTNIQRNQNPPKSDSKFVVMMALLTFQVRTTGPIDILTHQPVKGRKRAGGIRFGEMERDSLLAHGSSFLLQDRLLNCSDRSLVRLIIIRWVEDQSWPTQIQLVKRSQKHI